MLPLQCFFNMIPLSYLLYLLFFFEDSDMWSACRPRKISVTQHLVPLLFSQIKAVDNGRPQKSSTCRLHIEWIPKPVVAADAAPLQFEESPFTFSVMESDPVAHMVGVVATESSDIPVWFEITGTGSDTLLFVIQGYAWRL